MILNQISDQIQLEYNIMHLKVEILEQSFEKLKPKATKFISSFYNTLFTDYPQVESLLGHTNKEEQHQKLWKTLELFVENLRKPDILAVTLKGLGARHSQYTVIAEHYPRVGDALLKTLSLYLGSSWTPEVRQAWIEAYRVITDLIQEGEQELKRSQVQLIQIEKMTSLGQIVAGVAHEINNPVNFIYGNLDYINQYVQTLLEVLRLYQHHYPQPVAEIQDKSVELDLNFVLDDLHKSLTSARSGAERIREVIQSLRNFSQLDGVEMKPVNIHEGLDNTLLLLQHRLKGSEGKPGIRVIKEYGNLPFVECYAGQVNQVFMNILNNAIDALDVGTGNQEVEIQPDFSQILSSNSSSPRPTICIRTSMESSSSVTVCIADNGPGIPEKLESKIFDLFFTTKPVGQGTGLGLSISYEIIVKKHGGQLKCISTPGVGAQFFIEIPIQQRDPAG